MLGFEPRSSARTASALFLLASYSNSYQFHVKVYLRLVCLCLSWLSGRWKGLNMYPIPGCCLSHRASAERRRCREEPRSQGCGFNAKHPLAPKAGNFAGSQVMVAGAQGECTLCRRVFGWYSGIGAAGSAGCMPRQRETCRKSCASRKKGEGE